MTRKTNSSFISALLAVLCYVIFAIVALIQYPSSYSPTRNWLSDLGNADVNPQGAIFYNIGIISTALLLMVFFLGLSRWKLENKRIQITMVLLTQVFGILGSFCMIMSAIFPINLLEMHRIWSMSLYFMLATAFVFSVAALRYHPKVPRWLLILGISTAVMVNLTNFLPTMFVLEWLTVVLFLGYVSLVGIETKRLQLN